MPRESLTARRARGTAVLEGLRGCYPDAKTELDFGTPFLLVAEAVGVPAIAVDTHVDLLARRLFCRPSSECMLAVLS